MHRRLIIKKTWLSALSYAQSRISLVFCCSLGFLVPWLSSLTADSDFLCKHGEEADHFMKNNLCFSSFLLFLGGGGGGGGAGGGVARKADGNI